MPMMGYSGAPMMAYPPIMPPINPAKTVIISILFLGLIVIFLFAFIPMSDKYQGYAWDSNSGPAFWVGLLFGVDIWLISLARWYL